MLEYLRIQNLALIEDVELEFSSGINALTGETGAGKSFILKALAFLTGDRLGADLVRPGKDKAVTEAVFRLPDGAEVLLRRELLAENGRSRLFINDKLSSQDAVRDLKPALLMHTSQHGQQKLLLPAFQSRILDDFMHRPDLLTRRDDALKALSELFRRREDLQARIRELEDKRDLLEFQRQEIDKVAPLPGEEEELESERRELRHQEDLNGAVEQALAALYGDDGQGLLAGMAALEKNLRHLADLDESFGEDLSAVESMYPALSDLSGRLRRKGSRESERDAEAIESRLYALSQLKRKLHRSIEDILSLKDEITENLGFLDGCGLDLKQLEREENALAKTLAEVLAELNPARRAAAEKLKELLEAELRELGFAPEVAVEFVFTPRELLPGRDGCAEEKAQIFWKPNPGQSAQPLDRIASGGELSRFLLALVSLLSKRSREEPTLIFDEVDAGVGGITLNRLADKLASLAESRQIILITHWPNLASSAKSHFFIEKEVSGGETFTRCRRLRDTEVFDEIVRMAGGGEQGKALAAQLRG